MGLAVADPDPRLALTARGGAHHHGPPCRPWRIRLRCRLLQLGARLAAALTVLRCLLTCLSVQVRSYHKKTYCCEHEHKGCQPYHCHHHEDPSCLGCSMLLDMLCGMSRPVVKRNTTRGRMTSVGAPDLWGQARRERLLFAGDYCCGHFQIACAATTLSPLGCDAAWPNLLVHEGSGPYTMLRSSPPKGGCSSCSVSRGPVHASRRHQHLQAAHRLVDGDLAVHLQPSWLPFWV